MARTTEACLLAIKTAAPNLTHDEVEQIVESLESVRKQNVKMGIEIGKSAKKAARDLSDAARFAALNKEREKIINDGHIARLSAYALGDEFKANPAMALEAKIAGIQRLRGEGRLSVDAQQRGHFEEYLGGMRMDLERAGLHDLFTSDKMQAETARALVELRSDRAPGGPPEAIKLAEIIRKWEDKVKFDLNERGANIGTLDDYIARTSHDPLLLAKAAGLTVKADDPAHFQAWLKDARTWLDAERTDLSDDALRESYVGLVSGDHLRVEQPEPTGFIGPRNLAKKVSEHRSLHFKDADSWMAYNAKYGQGNLSASVTSMLRTGAQNAGLMTEFGTNPRYVFREAARAVAATMRDTPEKLGKFNNTLPSLERMMSQVDGTARIPENLVGANLATTVRMYENVKDLPLMLLSQFSDLATFASEMKDTFGRGYLQSIGEALGGLGVGMGDAERKKLWSSIGVFADGFIGDLMTKFGSMDNPRGKQASLMQKYFGMIGATGWNDSMKRRAAEVISHSVALERGKGFDSLDKNLKQAFSQYGIGAAEWDAIRANVQHYDGREFAVIEGLEGDASRKYRAFLTDRTGYAVLQPGAKTNYYMLWGTDLKRGTVAGEALRFTSQFKGYPTEFINRVLGRTLYGRGADTLGQALTNKNGEMVALAQLVAWSTAFGYLSMTAKDLVKGKEPRDLTDPANAWKTFIASAAQGNGLGIYGDFLFGPVSRSGVGAASTLLGPAFSDVAHIDDMLLRTMRGEQGGAEVFREALRDTAALHPYSSIAFNGYGRIALDYLILYRLQEEMNPGSLARMEARARKDNGQEYIFPPSQQ